MRYSQSNYPYGLAGYSHQCFARQHVWGNFKLDACHYPIHDYYGAKLHFPFYSFAYIHRLPPRPQVLTNSQHGSAEGKSEQAQLKAQPVIKRHSHDYYGRAIVPIAFALYQRL